MVIGDAVHAPSPSSGQGASLAIEDAVELGRSLRDLPDVYDAFAVFERARRSRVEPIVRQAARINDDKAATGAARVFRDLMLPLFLELMTRDRRAEQVYRYHIDWDAPPSSLPTAGCRSGGRSAQ